MPMLTMSVMRLPVCPFHAPERTAVGELAHLGEDGVHLGHHVLPVDDDGPVRAVAEGDVEDGAVLGAVDLLAREHPVAPVEHARLPGQIEEELHRLLGDAVLRVVDEHVGHLEREALEALRVGGEEIAHVHRQHRVAVGGERPPGRGFRQHAHGGLRFGGRG